MAVGVVVMVVFIQKLVTPMKICVVDGFRILPMKYRILIRSEPLIASQYTEQIK